MSPMSLWLKSRCDLSMLCPDRWTVYWIANQYGAHHDKGLEGSHIWCSDFLQNVWLHLNNTQKTKFTIWMKGQNYTYLLGWI